MSTENKPDGAAGLSNGGLCMLDDDEADPVRLWAEIHRLRAAVQGPDGHPSWQAAATAERMRRVRAGNALVRARDGYLSEAATGLPVLPQWRDETLRIIESALHNVGAKRQ